MKYSPLVTQYFDKQQYVGEFLQIDKTILSAENGAPGVSDIVKLAVKLDAENKIIAAKFKAYGNPYTIAVLAWICESMCNKPVEQLSEISYQTIIDSFELPDNKIKSAILIEDLLKKLLLQYQQRD